ncbi:MAG: aldo/keto reductase [Bacteroidia bacterium]
MAQEMIYRRLGKSGLQVSALSFGSWVTFGAQVNDTTAEECMKMAYDAGINFFDNAEVYASGKSEIVMGNILKKMGWDRTSYVISSKVFWGGKKPNQTGLSRKHVFEACHNALKRLQLDYLDLYFCHRPDPNTPIEETVRAMHDLITQGKILYWGTSEWSADQLMEAHAVAEKYNLYHPVMEQPQYNLLWRHRFEVEYKPVFDQYGMGTTIWSPLASGYLTGKYINAIPSDTRLSRPDLQWLRERLLGSESGNKAEQMLKFQALAQEAGVSMTHLAINWCMKNPNVSTVILGASRAEQLADNLKALETLHLVDDTMMEKLNSIFPIEKPLVK